MAANVKYKDSVFSLLFNDPDTLRELYSALEGIKVDPVIPISINTLSDALYMDRHNDISFTIGTSLVNILEHQSSINPNMPLRFLSYIARIYEKIVDQMKEGSIYRERLIKIPFPEFIVLYNGIKPYPDYQKLKLSDAFEDIRTLKGKNIPLELELIVKVYNINKGHNEDKVSKCEKLQGYSTFIYQVREKKKTMTLEKAIEYAVDYCIDHNILSKFLQEHSSEVRNMLLTEWKWDDAKRIWQEEAREDGREEGIEIGIEKGIEKGLLEVAKKALTEGLPVELVHKLTGLDTSTINSLSSQ